VGSELSVCKYSCTGLDYLSQLEVTFYPINCYLLFPSGGHVAIISVRVDADASNVGIDGERI
jgi:hypothetical protein